MEGINANSVLVGLCDAVMDLMFVENPEKNHLTGGKDRILRKHVSQARYGRNFEHGCNILVVPDHGVWR